MHKGQKQLKYHITDSGEEEGTRGRGGREEVGGHKVKKVERESMQESTNTIWVPQDSVGEHQVGGDVYYRKYTVPMLEKLQVFNTLINSQKINSNKFYNKDLTQI